MNSFVDLVMGHHETTLTAKQRATHTYVIGQPGTGKSRAFESWIMQDIALGRGVGVIDPHGDLYKNLLARLAVKPDLWERVILFDPLDPKWVVGFNPLEAGVHIHQERLALYLTDVVTKVWRINTANAPRMVWLLTNSFLALSSLHLSLLELPRFLVDRVFRDALMPRVKQENVRNYFEYEFPKSTAGANQWITPVLNKLGGLLFDLDARLIFSGKSTINFREIMDQKKVLLVNLPKGIFGEGVSALLAAFIVAHFQKAALSRASSTKRPAYYLYLDEFQNYTTDNIQDVLSESRKYALSLTLAHQYLDQLSSNLQSAVLNTAGTVVSFRVGYQDASRLAKEIFPTPDYIQTYRPELKVRQSYRAPFPYIRIKSESTGWGSLSLELSQLRHRQFWFRRRGNRTPIKQTTFYMPDPKITKDLKKQINLLRDFSGERYAKLKSEVLQSNQGLSNQQAKFEVDIPQWSG